MAIALESSLTTFPCNLLLQNVADHLTQQLRCKSNACCGMVVAYNMSVVVVVVAAVASIKIFWFPQHRIFPSFPWSGGEPSVNVSAKMPTGSCRWMVGAEAIDTYNSGWCWQLGVPLMNTFFWYGFEKALVGEILSKTSLYSLYSMWLRREICQVCMFHHVSQQNLPLTRRQPWLAKRNNESNRRALAINLELCWGMFQIIYYQSSNIIKKKIQYSTIQHCDIQVPQVTHGNEVI